jgi:diguanylate cyclase (GGDEF)-like protein
VVETYVPVRDNDFNVIGVFEIYRDVTRVYEEIDKVLTTSLLILTTILVFVFAVSYLLLQKGVEMIKKAQEELERIATTDGLTGLFNRRHILSRAAEELARANRWKPNDAQNSAEIGFIMMDIDFFKKINDQYGHQCGDEILRQVAERIRGSLRQYDMGGRYGGEEFLAVLPHSDFKQTEVVARRIWSLVRETPFHYNGLELRVTISLGISSRIEDDVGVESILKRADDALYHAKRAGRDQLSCTEG